MTDISNAENYIAGNRTVQDWHDFKTKLADADEVVWAEAFEEYFKARLNLRYLEPIKMLQDHGTFRGEGFSIVAIQCTLIEFLAALTKGCNYRYLKRGDPPLGPHEYSRSRDLFVDFLSTNPPFSGVFTGALAEDFYGNIRCGLLHEAATKNGWKVWASGSQIIDANRKIMWRDNLQEAINIYIEQYGQKLLTDKQLQEAFIRKFDYLAST
ncbi:hypothetical protein FMN50_00475 [Rhodobacterales bacterium]|nr:hypothetical protein FMN50_00475 [Rhodobacterales bacterium]